MDNTKVLIGSRQASEIEAMLSDVPPAVEVRFLPDGESLRDHIADVDILFGRLGEDEMEAATALRWVHQPHAGVEDSCIPLSRQAMLYSPTVEAYTAHRLRSTPLPSFYLLPVGFLTNWNL